MMLLDDFPPHFALLDAYDSAADGLVGVMGCPRPPGRAGSTPARDALAVDMVAARHLGVRDPRESSILRAGLPLVRRPVRAGRGRRRRRAARRLARAVARRALGAAEHPRPAGLRSGSGRAPLFVPEMDEEAFPPLQPEGRLLRLGRRAVRRSGRPAGTRDDAGSVVIGAGMGGLTAALRLARLRLPRARARGPRRARRPGLGARAGGFRFDARPVHAAGPPRAGVGLRRARARPGRAGHDATAVEDVYEVEAGDGRVVRFHADLDETAAGLDRRWPGGGRRYRSFVARPRAIHRRTPSPAASPRARASRRSCAPGPGETSRSSCGPSRSVLRPAGLPRAVAGRRGHLDPRRRAADRPRRPARWPSSPR